MEDLHARVRRFVAELHGIDELDVTPDTPVMPAGWSRATGPPGDRAGEEDSIVARLSDDSLDRVELVMAFEEAVGLELAEADTEYVFNSLASWTVADLVRYLEEA